MAAIAFIVVVLLLVCPSIGGARASGDLESPVVHQSSEAQPAPVALPFQYEEEPAEDEPEEEPEEEEPDEEPEEELPPEEPNMAPEEPPELH
jgi:hypothetical protein